MQKELAGGSPPLNESESTNRRHRYSRLRSRGAVAIAIFLLAFGVRVLTWHDTRLEVGKVQSAVVADYQRVADLLRTGGLKSFLSSSSPLADLNNLGHPPGYSVLIAAVYSFRHSVAAVQFVQITADALSAVLIFLIVAELFPLSAGVVAGLLAAFSPQLAWNSVLLLPDSISVVPILCAIYLLARGLQKPRILNFLVIGALIGLSCWLRANAMLLGLFVAAAVPLLVKGTQSWRFALAVVCGAFLIVLPLTIRNAIVFHRFIPLSLGAGQTLLEGIADYDKESKFGIPNTDMGIMKQEAELYQRPDYYGTLFNPDGVERERARLSRGFAIIRSHPLWFAGVMAKRASSMVRLERSRLISINPPPSQFDRRSMQPAWIGTPAELLASGIKLSPQAQTSMEAGNDFLDLIGDDSKYGKQFAAGIKGAKPDTNYLLVVPVKIERGRMRLGVTDFGDQPYVSTVIETTEQTQPQDQPLVSTELPFTTTSNQKVQLLFANEASTVPRPLAKIGSITIYELGPARFLWTRYPRFIIHAIQKIYLTAVVLPLAIVGLLILVFRKQSTALVILSIVPVYFFTVQSAVHTEYRYVLAVDYFLFAFVGIAVMKAGQVTAKAFKKRT